MSNLKRFLAMTLVMLMMVSAFAITASASSNFDDVTALKNDELSRAVDLLHTLGVAKGTTESTFDPESPVTREQFAMFTARIHSGLPETFALTDDERVKVAADEKAQTVFADVNGKDVLWYLPINYCYEAGFITGKIAPTDEKSKDGTFGLGDHIIFQDAITMLVRSLGYGNSGLTYPVGFLAKAREIGLFDGFNGDISKMRAQDIVTRADMARLLYNYFRSDFYSTEVVWNSSTRSYMNQDTFVPVSQRFGITKIEGYVTAVEGAALPMWVEDPYASRQVGAGGAVIDSNWVRIGLNDPISMRNATEGNAGHYNIVISWVTPENSVANNTIWVQNTDASGNLINSWSLNNLSTNNRVVGHIRTTQKALGLDGYFSTNVDENSRYLLGLKVEVFVDSSNRPRADLPPARVLGTKKTASAAEVPGDIMSGDNRNRILDSFRFDFADGSARETFNQYNAFNATVQPLQPGVNVDNFTGVIGQARQDEGDINRYTGYVFTSEGTGLARNVYDSRDTSRPIGLNNFNQANDLRYLAGIIKTGNFGRGALNVEVILNGTNYDGTPNRYVIFTPYEAGYIRQHDQGPNIANLNPRPEDGYLRITRANGTWYDVRRNTSVQRFINVATAGSWSTGEPARERAYFFSNQGEHIIVAKQLTELTANQTTAEVTDLRNGDRNNQYNTAAMGRVTLDIGVANSAFVGSYGRITIDFSHENVYYSSLSQRRTAGQNSLYSATGRPADNSTFNGVATAMNSGYRNQYEIKAGQNYRVYTAATIGNFNYGFVGQDNGAAFIFLTSDTPAVTQGIRMGRVISDGGPSIVNGVSVRTLLVYNIASRITETILVTSPGIVISYPARSIIRYMNVSNPPNATHRVLWGYTPGAGVIQIPRNGLKSSNATPFSMFTIGIATAPVRASALLTFNDAVAQSRISAGLGASATLTDLTTPTNMTLTGRFPSAEPVFTSLADSIIASTTQLVASITSFTATTTNFGPENTLFDQIKTMYNYLDELYTSYQNTTTKLVYDFITGIYEALDTYFKTVKAQTQSAPGRPADLIDWRNANNGRPGIGYYDSGFDGTWGDAGSNWTAVYDFNWGIGYATPNNDSTSSITYNNLTQRLTIGTPLTWSNITKIVSPFADNALIGGTIFVDAGDNRLVTLSALEFATFMNRLTNRPRGVVLSALVFTSGSGSSQTVSTGVFITLDPSLVGTLLEGIGNSSAISGDAPQYPGIYGDGYIVRSITGSFRDGTGTYYYRGTATRAYSDNSVASNVATVNIAIPAAELDNTPVNTTVYLSGATVWDDDGRQTLYVVERSRTNDAIYPDRLNVQTLEQIRLGTGGNNVITINSISQLNISATGANAGWLFRGGTPIGSLSGVQYVHVTAVPNAGGMGYTRNLLENEAAWNAPGNYTYGSLAPQRVYDIILANIQNPNDRFYLVVTGAQTWSGSSVPTYAVVRITTP